jgi:hypothetical protein
MTRKGWCRVAKVDRVLAAARAIVARQNPCYHGGDLLPFWDALDRELYLAVKALDGDPTHVGCQETKP